MKKTLGYGWKLSGESLENAIHYFLPDQWLSNKKEVCDDIKKARQNRDISKNSKPKVFKVVVECED